MGKTNASSSAFGWEFQSNAAIVLMLENIQEATSVKVEGATDDIEITLENGNMIYSQAKSVFDSDDYSHVKGKMQDGLRTLNEDAKLSNVEELIYITNSPNPFNNIRTMYCFSSGFASYSFAELPDLCQSAIKDILASQGYSSIDVKKLKVCALPFLGDGSNRYRVIKEEVREFLQRVEMGDSGLGQKMLETWQLAFSANATQHACVSITKKQLLWPLVVSECELGADDRELQNCDEAEVENIAGQYRTVICNNTERFQFVTKVMTDYKANPVPKSRDSINLFVEANWENYESDFDIDDARHLKIVIKITVRKVLQTRVTIDAIRRGTGL